MTDKPAQPVRGILYLAGDTESDRIIARALAERIEVEGQIAFEITKQNGATLRCHACGVQVVSGSDLAERIKAV